MKAHTTLGVTEQRALMQTCERVRRKLDISQSKMAWSLRVSLRSYAYWLTCERHMRRHHATGIKTRIGLMMQFATWDDFKAYLSRR